MNRLIIALLPLLLAFGTGVPAYAQGDEWKTLNNEAESLYRQGHYDRAIVVAKKALEVAEKAVGPDHPDVATTLNGLAVLYKTQGQYAQAEPLYKRSLAIDEKAYGPSRALAISAVPERAASGADRSETIVAPNYREEDKNVARAKRSPAA